MELIKKKWGEQFRDEMRKTGITQQWVAKQLFIKRSTLNNMLAGRTSIPEFHRKRLNDLLGTSIGDPDE